MKKPGSASSPLWYKDAILYELHVRAFADSNGDGIGDFPGLLGKLDYLQDLGVTCLWLLPFFPSPLRDDGYDVADYTAVNPSYGTLDDFQRFLDAAHERGMQVLIELVMNHSSDQHPWFERARRAPRGSVERNFYVWGDDPSRFPGVPIIFSDTEKSNWTWDPVAGQYFWHRFFSHQPDLNFDNPVVLEEMLNAMRFWLDRGVDGLRLDAIPYLIERDGTRCESLPETHAILRNMRAIVDSEYTNRFFLAEANQLPAEVRPYFGNGDECHMAFHFPLMPRIYVSLRQEDRLPIVEIMQQTPPIPDACQWGLFLRNHDELTLEMVSDDERDYMWLAYSADPRTRVNVGIRRRLAPLLDNNRQRIELLNSILFSFPGTPILYYGDELGMGDNVDLGDRNGVRTPMQWNGQANGGFSTAPADKLYFPVISDPVYGYQAVNVEEQQASPSSLLQWTRNMIGLRKLFAVFSRGTLRFLHPANRKVLAYLRESGDDSVLCVANLSRFAQPVALDLSDYAGRVPVEVLGYNPFPVLTSEPYVLTLAPYSFLWFELEHPPGEIRKPLAELHPAADPATLGPGLAERVRLDLNTVDTTGAVVATSLEPQAEIRTPSAPRVEASSASARNLLVHLNSQSPAALRNAAESLAQQTAESLLRLTITFPLNDGLSAGEAQWRDAPGTMRFSPYSSSPGILTQEWPHTAATYQHLARIAMENHSDAVLLIGTGAESPHAARDLAPDGVSARALAEPVLQARQDLCIATYTLGRYQGLFNNGVLRPLIYALYAADLRYPLAPDLALSIEMLQTIAAAPVIGPPEEAVAWPGIHAVRSGARIAEISMLHRQFPQPAEQDLTSLLTRILTALFEQAEANASFWQRNRPLYPIEQRPPIESHSAGEIAPTDIPDVTPMLDAFRLGVANLHEIWSQILSPGTLLGIKRAAPATDVALHISDALWVRVIYDFLAAYRSRSVSRAHIFGALLPLYLGWAASHVGQVREMSDSQSEEATAALSAAFASDKAYLMARWRWPDRFTP